MFNKPTRSHISIIFERLGFVFFALIAVASGNISNSINQMIRPEFWRSLSEKATDANSALVVFGGMALLLLVLTVLIVSFRYWLRTFFYIEGQNFVFERKTLFGKHSKLPIANIASVNIERNVFERFVGTSKVKIDLNSSHTANRTDFALVLKNDLAVALRDTLSSMKAQTNAPETAYSNAAAVPLNREKVVSFSTGEVIRHKLLSFSVWQIVLAGFAVETFFTSQSNFDIKSTVTVAVIALLGSAAALVWSIMNLAGFTVERDEKNIYIKSGLIRKTDFTFEHEKINAIFVKQPVLARLFGLYSIEIAVVGLGNEKTETPELCLLADKEQTERVLSLCAADFACAGETIPSHKAALVPAAVQSVIFSLLPLILLLSIYPQYTFFACGAVFVFSAWYGWMKYKTRTIAYDSNVFHYAKGIFDKKKVMFKYGNIQDTRIKTNFMVRAMNAGKMSLNILSGMRMKTHRTGYFELPNFEAVSNKMVEHEDSSTGLFG